MSAVIHLLLLPVLALTTLTVTDISVEAWQDGAVVTTMTPSGATLVTEIDYIGLNPIQVPTGTTIRFTGKNSTPGEEMIISIPAAHVEQRVSVQSDGTWETSIPTTLLPHGIMSATVRAATATDQSAPVTVAEFTVRSDEFLSTATWLFLITTSIAIVTLLLAVTLQLRYNLHRQTMV